MRGLQSPLPYFISCLLSIFLLLTSCVNQHEDKKSVPANASSFPLAGMTIDELQEKLNHGEYTSMQITQMYLDRIQQLDISGPALHAIIEINPEALEIASGLDEERDRGHIRGPLHGIPVILKDNIDTYDLMHTTAGSLAMLDNKPVKDAFLVQKLRQAGAIILGKSNLSEWANFRSYQSVSGWSSRGGQTKNPYVLDQSPCGSSSGSAVAVAADFCMVSVGTETDGSIACPSSMNGVVGIKPTIGLISRSGIIPISKTQDTPGPIARTVRDAAILLGAMSGYDPNDPTTKANVGIQYEDYTSFLTPGSLKGKRIGVEISMVRQPDAIGILLDHALEKMRKAGAEIIEVEYTAKYKELENTEFDLLKYEFKDGLNQYLAQSAGNMKSLEDIIRFNKENKKWVMPEFKQEIMLDAQAKGDLNSMEYIDNVTKLLPMKTYLYNLMEENNLDALCGVGNGAYSPAAVAGYPAITVPMGLVEDLPVGITFLCRPFDESGLLAIAYGYEQVSQKRTAPMFLPTYIRKP